MKIIIKRSVKLPSQFFFDIVGGNGRIVATSETYKRIAGAENAIKALRTAGLNCGVVERYHKKPKA